MTIVHFCFVGCECNDDFSTLLEGIIEVKVASRRRLAVDGDTLHVGRRSLWDDFLNRFGIEVDDCNGGADTEVWVVDGVFRNKRR